jgi:hypothetical protein
VAAIVQRFGFAKTIRKRVDSEPTLCWCERMRRMSTYEIGPAPGLVTVAVKSFKFAAAAQVSGVYRVRSETARGSDIPRRYTTTWRIWRKASLSIRSEGSSGESNESPGLPCAVATSDIPPNQPRIRTPGGLLV